jgi:hypothetical protein
MRFAVRKVRAFISRRWLKDRTNKRSLQATAEVSDNPSKAFYRSPLAASSSVA